jgi:adenosylcobinamide-phosphate synthase
MLDHAKAVIQALESGELKLARKRLAMIVGRDTQKLDFQGICRASIESVAESFCDGLLAPLFFAYLGGAPLALAYKAVSTLDSMVGYRNARYAEFGWASARLDDLLNFVPARLSALVIAAASRRPAAAFLCAVQDGPKQPSPNSGWPEGAFAGALGIQLGGPSRYQGLLSPKALLGRPEFALNLASVRAALALFMGASALALVTGELLWRWLRA